MSEPLSQNGRAIEKLAQHPLFRLMTARMQDLVCLYDLEGRILYASPLCQAMLGHAAEELAGQPLLNFVQPDDHAAVQQTFDALAAGADEVQRLVLRLRAKTDLVCWVEASFVAEQLADGKVAHICSILRDVTQQHEAAEEQKESAAHWTWFIEQHPGPIVIHHRGIIRYINEMGARSLNVADRKKVVGESLYDYIMPDQHQVLNERITQVERGEKTDAQEYNLYDLNGAVHRIQVFSVPVMYGGEQATQTVWRDITEQRAAEEALRESQLLLSSIYENITDGIFRTSADGTLLYGNQALAHLFGYDTVDELREVPIEQLYARPEQRKALQIDAEGDIRNMELELLRRDGSHFWGLVNSHSTLDAHGEVLHYDGAIADISDRKEAEQALLEAKERAEEMTRLKSAFLANMSHEIRTPLTSILGFAEIMAQEAPPDIREFADLIRTSGQRLMETLNSVLDLAQLEGGSMMLHPVQLDIVQQAMRVLFLFKLQAEQRGLELRIEVPSKQPVRAVLDQGALSRILTNLVSNAIKFTIRGSITIVVDQQPGGVEIRVTDTGIGIPPEMIARAFDKFYQVSTGMGRGYEGSGLGLTITQRLVELMGGTIRVESKESTGSTFFVWFAV